MIQVLDKTNRNVAFTILIMGVITQTLRAQGVCNNGPCQEVTAVYNKSASETIKPCDDFFTHVCEGWLNTVYKKYDKSTKYVRIRSPDRGEKAVRVIFGAHAMKSIKNPDETSSTETLDSDIQSVHFFKSCMLAHGDGDWELVLESMRRFFHEIDLPFFDESSGPGQVPFTPLLRLALQYDVNPIFRIDLRDYMVLLRKTGPVDMSSRDWPSDPEDTAKEWRQKLIDLIDGRTLEERARLEVAPLFEEFRIHMPEGTLMRIGRNYLAVNKSIKEYFLEKYSYKKTSFDAEVKAFELTYSEIFSEHLDGLIRMDYFTKHKLHLDRHYFEPLMILMRNPRLAQIFNDFLAVYLLKTDFLQELVRSTKCLDKFCDIDLYNNTEKFCTELTEKHLPWSTTAMVARLTHTEYSVLLVRAMFARQKLILVEKLASRQDMPNATRMFVVEHVSSYRLRGLNLKRTSTIDISENLFTTSPNDLAHNLIGLRKVKRAQVLTRVGYPVHRNISRLEEFCICTDSDMKDIFYPGAYLEFPNMIESLPRWTLFGAMGFVIGHELGHALVSAIKLSHSEAVSKGTRWEATYRSKVFEPALTCFKDLYIIAGHIKPDDDYVTEALADNIGHHLAEEAFKSYSKNATLENLPTGTGVTLKQMLYISRAYSWCGAEQGELFISTHPFNFHRVNRGMSNFKPFASAFNCSNESVMIAKKPCGFIY